jgi:antitoxin CcdA
MRASKEMAMPRRKSTAAIPKRATKISVRSKRKKWHDENSEAIQAYNKHVEKHGAFSDDVRSF